MPPKRKAPFFQTPHKTLLSKKLKKLGAGESIDVDDSEEEKGQTGVSSRAMEHNGRFIEKVAFDIIEENKDTRRKKKETPKLHTDAKMIMAYIQEASKSQSYVKKLRDASFDNTQFIVDYHKFYQRTFEFREFEAATSQTSLHQDTTEDLIYADLNLFASKDDDIPPDTTAKSGPAHLIGNAPNTLRPSDEVDIFDEFNKPPDTTANSGPDLTGNNAPNTSAEHQNITSAFGKNDILEALKGDVSYVRNVKMTYKKKEVAPTKLKKAKTKRTSPLREQPSRKGKNQDTYMQELPPITQIVEEAEDSDVSSADEEVECVIDSFEDICGKWSRLVWAEKQEGENGGVLATITDEADIDVHCDALLKEYKTRTEAPTSYHHVSDFLFLIDTKDQFTEDSQVAVQLDQISQAQAHRATRLADFPHSYQDLMRQYSEKAIRTYNLMFRVPNQVSMNRNFHGFIQYLGAGDSGVIKQKLRDVLLNPNNTIGITEVRHLFVGVDQTQRSVECWKFALWATIGARLNRLVKARQESHPAESLQVSTNHVRKEFYSFKGPDFVMENRHHTFMGRTSRLGVILEEYTYSIFFDEEILWSHMYKLTSEDMRVVHCAASSGMTNQWKQCLLASATQDAQALLDQHLST